MLTNAMISSTGNENALEWIWNSWKRALERVPVARMEAFALHVIKDSFTHSDGGNNLAFWIFGLETFAQKCLLQSWCGSPEWTSWLSTSEFREMLIPLPHRRTVWPEFELKCVLAMKHFLFTCGASCTFGTGPWFKVVRVIAPLFGHVTHQ